MRSVPPTGLPEATLAARQARHLPVNLVSLNRPEGAGVTFPPEGERLRLSDVGRLGVDARVTVALRRLAADKAPANVAQLVLWNVAGGLSWDEVAERSKTFANAYELTLAKDLVARLGKIDARRAGEPGLDTGRIFFEVEAASADLAAIADSLRTVITKSSVLGLKSEAGIPKAPAGPALAFRVQLAGTTAAPTARVEFRTGNGEGTAWAEATSFVIGADRVNGRPGDAASQGAEALKVDARALRTADAVASGLLERLTIARLLKGPRVKGKDTYAIQVKNLSPFVLSSVAVGGLEAPQAGSKDETGGVLEPVFVAPGRIATLHTVKDVVDALKLKKGVRAIGADLSGL